jgi:PKD repeat protein
MARRGWGIWLIALLVSTQVALGQDLGQQFNKLPLEKESRFLSSTLQLEVIPLSSGVPVRGSCPAHTDPQFAATLCPTEYTIELPADTTSLLVVLQKEGVTDLILAMSFGKSISDRLDDREDFWISRPIDSSPTRDTEGMLWDEDELRSEGTLPGTWYIGIITKEGSSQDYTIMALVETREPNQPPDADFTFSPSNPTTDDTVEFTDRSSDPDSEIVSWKWDFGDGETSTRRNPTHRYTRAGTYTVKLTVTDDGDLSDARTKSITVREALKPPQAPGSLQATAKSTTEITLTWQDNSDNEDGFLIERRRGSGSWREIDRVGRNTTRYTDSGLEPSTRYCYRLTAFNYAGKSGPSNEACATAKRENRPPTADAGPDQTVQVGETVQLDGSRSSDPDGDALSFKWRFRSRPSGSQATLSNSSSARPSFVPDVAGQYVVELTADDGHGGSDSDTVAVTAEEVPPPAYEYSGQLTRGRLGRLEVPDEIKGQLPEVARYIERPHTTHEGRRGDSLQEAGLQLNPSTGTIFGSPTQAGQFQFLIEVQDPQQEGQTVAFLWARVTVVEQPALDVAPQELRLAARLGDPDPTATFAVKNTGGGTLEWTARIDASWLQLQPTQGSLGAGESQRVTVTAMLAGLTAGTHEGTITVESPGVEMVIVKVTLDLRGPEEHGEPLVVEPGSLEFHARVSDPDPEPQTLTLTNRGDQSLMWDAAIEGDWLLLSFTGGTLLPGASVSLEAMVDATGLRAGTYQGSITFSVPRNPEIQPVTVPVTLTITKPEGEQGEGNLLALKFVKLEFLRSEDWTRELQDGCVVYTNISAELSPIRVTLPDGSTREFAIPSGREVIVCGDVVHLDTRS